MADVMDVLSEGLSHTEYLKVIDVASKLDEPPFRYSAKRREFTPSDGWFLLEADLDADIDESEFTEELMALAMKCCDVLNAHKDQVDTSDYLEHEPSKKDYKLVYDNLDETTAEAFVSALKESGYKPQVTKNGVSNITVTIQFTASTDWEHSTETDNISTIFTMVGKFLRGKSPKGSRI